MQTQDAGRNMEQHRHENQKGQEVSEKSNSVREYWRPANLLYPVPAVMVTCQDEEGRANIMTAAWAGTVCSDPVMVSVSIRKSRYSHDIIERTGEFVICLTTQKLVRAADWCGVKSGRDVDKFTALHLTKLPSRFVAAPGIAESPVCLECRVRQILPLGSHDMFVAEVLSTDVDPQYLDEKGRLDLGRAELAAYSHGTYYGLGEALGTFGFSVRKKPAAPAESGKRRGKPAGRDKKTPPAAGQNKTENSGRKRR
jgi:flavin reductase (DIM6/NTAB) family NADH-FMN oxidoreductase RutF